MWHVLDTSSRNGHSHVFNYASLKKTKNAKRQSSFKTHPVILILISWYDDEPTLVVSQGKCTAFTDMNAWLLESPREEVNNGH